MGIVKDRCDGSFRGSFYDIKNYENKSHQKLSKLIDRLGVSQRSRTINLSFIIK